MYFQKNSFKMAETKNVDMDQLIAIGYMHELM